MRVGPRLTWCLLAVVVTALLSWWEIRDFMLTVIGVPLLALMGLIGTRTPFLLHIIFEHKTVAPDSSLWRSGLSAMLIFSVIYGVLSGNAMAFAIFVFEINLLYCGAKTGCSSKGCCRQVGRWPSLFPSLAIVEAILSFCIAAICAWIIFNNSPFIAAMFGQTTHFMLRTFSYWSRSKKGIVLQKPRLFEFITTVIFVACLILVVE